MRRLRRHREAGYIVEFDGPLPSRTAMGIGLAWTEWVFQRDFQRGMRLCAAFKAATR